MTAATLNARLSEPNGLVRVATMTNATIYDHRHAGCFSERPNPFTGRAELFVRHGKKTLCLGPVERPLVGIHLGRKQ